VSAEGVTFTLVPVTVPIPLILRLVALATDHVSVALCPVVTNEGATVNELIVGVGGGGAPDPEDPPLHAARESAAN